MGRTATSTGEAELKGEDETNLVGGGLEVTVINSIRSPSQYSTVLYIKLVQRLSLITSIKTPLPTLESTTALNIYMRNSRQ